MMLVFVTKNVKPVSKVLDQYAGIIPSRWVMEEVWVSHCRVARKDPFLIHAMVVNAGAVPADLFGI
jgi:hypothetical protein